MNRLFSPQNQRQWVILSISILAIGVLWTFYSRIPTSDTQMGQMPASPREGFSAPDFALDLLGGGQVTLSELHGKPVVVNVWASWCGPCRAEMPAMEKVYQTYKELGLVVIGLNTTYQDSETDAAAFVKEFGLTFPIALDRNGAVSRRYLVTGLPSTFFIDRKGIVHSVVVGGPMSETLIQTKVEALLKDTP